MGSRTPPPNRAAEQQIAMNQQEIQQKRQELAEQRISIIKAASGAQWTAPRPVARPAAPAPPPRPQLPGFLNPIFNPTQDSGAY